MKLLDYLLDYQMSQKAKFLKPNKISLFLFAIFLFLFFFFEFRLGFLENWNEVLIGREADFNTYPYDQSPWGLGIATSVTFSFVIMYTIASIASKLIRRLFKIL